MIFSILGGFFGAVTALAVFGAGVWLGRRQASAVRRQPDTEEQRQLRIQMAQLRNFFGYTGDEQPEAAAVADEQRKKGR